MLLQSQKVELEDPVPSTSGIHLNIKTMGSRLGGKPTENDQRFQKVEVSGNIKRDISERQIILNLSHSSNKVASRVRRQPAVQIP
jgi:hypothetical protein